jgi:short-subunit dehydrogenase
MNKIIKIIVLLFLIEIIIILSKIILEFNKFFLLQERDIIKIYKSIDNNPTVVITGSSSGQGKEFALQFAKRNFNLLLIGSKKLNKVKKQINKLYPTIIVKILIKDFSNANNDEFYIDIQNEINKLDINISIFINNVAYRIGWIDYQNLDNKYIFDAISVKPISYSILTKMIIPIFLKRTKNGLKSCLINISAQCMYNTFGLGLLYSSDISVPYLNVYEACNAYTYYFTNSIYKEYKDKFNILNITPGAVITENTPYLQNTIFSVTVTDFVSCVIKLIGNTSGISCGHWKHAISSYLINIFPFIKNNILEKVGRSIALNFMDKK